MFITLTKRLFFVLSILLCCACHHKKEAFAKTPKIIRISLLSFELKWDVHAAQVVEDSVFKALKADISKYRPQLMELFLDSSVVADSAYCFPAGPITKGDIAICILKQSKMLPSELINRGRNCVIYPNCSSPLAEVYFINKKGLLKALKDYYND